MRHSDGYGTQVGAGSVELSGGDVQRLATTKASLKNTPIVLLDEAISDLDTVTEAKIKGAVETLEGGRTILVVAPSIKRYC